MNHTDPQLKQALAKMLPKKIHFDLCADELFWNERFSEVLDTELLHLCWLVEQSLPEQDQNHYTTQLIFNAIGPDNQNLVVWEALTASWQQRTIALAKVKGVEIV